LFVAVIYYSLKNQNFGSAFLLIDCTAYKRFNWHWYIQQRDQAWTWKLSFSV